MAKNTGESRNRLAVKWIRDKAKAAYEKQDTCYICGTQQDLELHHVYSITRLLERWSEQKGYDVSTDDGILAVRDEFIAEHHRELYDLVYTLCNKDHVKLHGIYGKKPALGSETKQSNWIERQRLKYENGEGFKESLKTSGSFSAFY